VNEGTGVDDGKALETVKVETVVEPAPVIYCANCQAPLAGKFCHDCGQSVKSVVRPVSHMLEDTMDILFHVDERIVHTLPALYLKPGYLTLEYFAGRRVRYVAPFRLMFVFCLLAFFLSHLAISMNTRWDGTDAKTVVSDTTDDFADADKPRDVRRTYNEWHQAMVDPNVPEVAKVAMRAKDPDMRAAANARLAQLGGEPLSNDIQDKVESSGDKKVMHSTWLNEKDAVDIPWLPDAFNARLTNGMMHIKKNIEDMANGGQARREAARRTVDGLFAVLPQTMFIMLPLFAILLKIFYVFRRRLYMEHVIVALHSHAFMFLSLLLMVGLGLIAGWVRPHAAWLARGLGWVELAMGLWIPVYLLLMQKRVYRQGWFMTLFKYWLVGSCYFWLLGFAVTIALMVSMAH
jgi:hypothetical protein